MNTSLKDTLQVLDTKIIYVDDSNGVEYLEEALCDSSIIYLDTETTGLDAHSSKLLLIQLSDGLKHDGVSYTFIVEFSSMREKDKAVLRELLYNKELVIHNAAFDLCFLSEHLELDILKDKVKVYDTQVAEAVLGAGKVKELRGYTSLINVVKRRVGVRLNKDIRGEFINHDGVSFTEDQLKYSALDVYYLREIRRQQIKEARTNGLEETFRLEFELAKHVSKMKLNGVKIDAIKWAEIIDKARPEYDETKLKVIELAEPYVKQLGMFAAISLNLGSPTQLLAFLNNSVGLDLDDTSEQSLKFANHPLCDAILEFRKVEKLIDSFGGIPSAINKVTGRLHPEFNQCFTATGRFSADTPNVQQIPSKGNGAKLRECFVAAKGYKLICCDYSQIELRILAELSQEESLLEAYRIGRDIHLQTASVALGIAPELITPEQRGIAKTLNFGVCYGGGPGAIAKGLMKAMSAKEAQIMLQESFGVSCGEDEAYIWLATQFIDSYFRAMPKAKEFLDKTGQNALYNRYSETPLGRKRYYTELDSPEINEDPKELKKRAGSVRRKGMNHPIQGCSADITKFALVKIGKEFDKLGDSCGRTLLTVHDEIVTEVKEEMVEELAELQRKLMVEAGELFIHSVPVEVDVKVGDFWTKE